MPEPTGLDPSAGAAPIVAPAGAAPVASGTVTPPAGFVPLAALTGEQTNTTRAREEAATLRAHMELAGFRFGEDGTPVAPIPPAPAPVTPRISPAVETLATQLGIEPSALQGAIRETLAEQAPMYMDPLARQSFEQVKRGMAADDRTFPIYAKTFDAEIEKRVGGLPSHLHSMARAHPQIIEDARAAAIVKHLPEILAQAGRTGPGTVVGRFTEGTASGTGVPQTTRPFSEEGVKLMRQQGYTDEQIAAAAERREVRR